MKMRFYILIAGFILTSGACYSQAINKASIKHVNAKEFRAYIESGKGQLVDMRTPNEFNAGHIKGAQMIDYYAPTYKDNLSKLDTNKPIYIYCRSGNRSGKSVALIQELGFIEIVNLQRGIRDWLNGGYTLTQE